MVRSSAVRKVVRMRVVLLWSIERFHDARNHVCKAETSDERFKRFVLVLEAVSKTLKLSVGLETHLIEAATSFFKLSYTSLATLAELALGFAVLESTLCDERSIRLTGYRYELLTCRHFGDLFGGARGRVGIRVGV